MDSVRAVFQRRLTRYSKVIKHQTRARPEASSDQVRLVEVNRLLKLLIMESLIDQVIKQCRRCPRAMMTDQQVQRPV